MHQRLQSVFQKFIYCQPETTKRVVSCFSRLMNLVNKQLAMLEFIYKFNLHTIIYYIHVLVRMRTYTNHSPVPEQIYRQHCAAAQSPDTPIFVRVIALNYFKAFDIVKHSTLMQKLAQCLLPNFA